MSAPSEPRDGAPALGRGIALLDRLNTDGACSLERLARETAWPKSSVARLLRSLERAGLIARDPVTRHYRALCRLVRHGAAEDLLRGPAAGVMARLADHAGQTVELFAFDPTRPADSLTMIERCEPEDAVVHLRARIGFQRDLAELDALSQLVFAFGGYKPGRRRHWVWRGGRQDAVDTAEATRLVEGARARGLGLDVEPNSNGVFRYAAPLRLAGGRMTGALALAQLCTLNGPPPPNDTLAALVREAAVELNQTLGKV